MDLSLTPGRIGLSTATRLGIASIMAIILTTTIAKKEEGSNFSSMTIKTIPAEARPRVRSKTQMKTVACFKLTQPQQHDVAMFRQRRNLGSGPDREPPPKSFTSLSAMPGPCSIGESSYVISIICGELYGSVPGPCFESPTYLARYC